MRNASGLILSEGKTLPAPPSGREWAVSYTVNVGGDRVHSGIKIYPVPSVDSLPRGRMSSRGQGNFLSLGWETILEGG